MNGLIGVVIYIIVVGLIIWRVSKWIERTEKELKKRKEDEDEVSER